MCNPRSALIAMLLAGGSFCFPASAAAGPLVDLGADPFGQSRAVDINDSELIAITTDDGGAYSIVSLFDAALTALGADRLSGTYSAAHAINNLGEIAGSSTTANGVMNAYLATFRVSGGVVNLGNLGGSYAAALDINDNGDAVGYMLDGDDPPTAHAFLYSGGVTMSLGGLSGPSGDGVANLINNDGLVAGDSLTAQGERHAFVSSGGILTDTNALGGYVSQSMDINDDGTVVGTSLVSPGVTRGFAYSNAASVDIGTLGGDSSTALAINDAGAIVGSAQTKSGEMHAYRSVGGKMTDLGTLATPPSGAFSEAVAINESGQVAGNSRAADGNLHAFVYSHGKMTDLGTLGGASSEVVAIDKSGRVIGNSLTSGGATHAFVRLPECGDGVLDPLEDCDDGNTAAGDCCASDCTYPGPATTCLVAAKSSLTIQDDEIDGKDSLKWRWSGGGPVLQGDLGDPSASTTYTLCVSDSTGGVDRLVTQLVVAPGSAWTNEEPEGWSYSDRAGSSSGVTRVSLRAAAEGKARAEVRARGVALPMPEAHSASELFDQDTRVTVQLFSSAGPTCWTSEFTTAKRNTAAAFSASAQ